MYQPESNVYYFTVHRFIVEGLGLQYQGFLCDIVLEWIVGVEGERYRV